MINPNGCGGGGVIVPALISNDYFSMFGGLKYRDFSWFIMDFSESPPSIRVKLSIFDNFWKVIHWLQTFYKVFLLDMRQIGDINIRKS